MKKELLVLFLLLLVSFPAVKELLKPGGFTSHDLTHHVIRQISMDKLLSEGQFPPRWSGELNNGYGYPVFLFNYPLPAMVGKIFHQLGFNFVDSVKAVLFTSMIISTAGMYLFLKELLGSRLSAFLGAVFYLYAPIRFLNVYVSASVGSALALGIIPFVFWSMVEIRKGGKWASLTGALSLAALILSHNVTALIFMPVIVVYGWILARGKIFSRFGLMFLLGLGLSAWFWLPAIAEKQFIQFDQIYKDFYKDQFINIGQLIHSPWGYGLSHPQHPESGDMSYQLGLTQILVMILLMPVLLIFKKNRETRTWGIFALAFFILSVLMMLKISSPIWDTVSFLQLIQFPLRFQTIAIFCAAITAGVLVKYLPFKKVLFIILLILVILANRNHWHINEKFDPGEQYYLNLKTTSTTYGEHLPKWGRAMEKLSPGKLEIINGQGTIKILKDQSNLVLAEIEATNAKLRFNQIYFPGWTIKVDKKVVNFNYLIDGESYGLPVFDIASDEHQVLAEFKNTTDRNIADTISLVSVVLWLILLCKLLAPNYFQVKK